MKNMEQSNETFGDPKDHLKKMHESFTAVLVSHMLRVDEAFKETKRLRLALEVAENKAALAEICSSCADCSKKK